VNAISDLPMPDDIDADYSPQYVKLARILRDKIETGQYNHSQRIPAADLMSEHKASQQVAYNALAMLAANRYVAQPVPFKPYHVTWNAAPGEGKAGG
jgi:DNA-binding GntR family transcriptional regulator